MFRARPIPAFHKGWTRGRRLRIFEARAQQGHYRGRRDISSFDTSLDGIGAKEGYGAGTYVLHDSAAGGSFGPDIDHIIAYFRDRRGAGKFNLKRDVSLAAFKDFLPRVSLLTPVWNSAGSLVDAKVTLHGSEVAAAYTDNTGRKVTEIHKPDVAARVLASLRLAAKLGRAVVGQSDEIKGPPPHVRLNILYLPLSLDGETISHFFAYVRLDPLDRP